MTVPDDWLLTTARTAIHRPTGTAVLSDLHLGYAEARRRAGEAVPSVDLDETLAPLATVLGRLGVCRLVIAGDLFEAGFQEDLSARLLEWLERKEIELLAIIPGNHDRDLKPGRGGLPVCPGPLLLGSWHVVHGDSLPAGPVVHGHFHPCLRLQGMRQAAPCYLASKQRLILPAYSVEAAGVNVLGRSEWDGFHCHVIAGDRILDFGDLASLQQ
jgi:metallophosphoesterase superfamily enzyme